MAEPVIQSKSRMWYLRIYFCFPDPVQRTDSVCTCRLGQRCIAYEADDRPTFHEVQKTLSAIKLKLKSRSADDSTVNYNQRAFSFPR